MARSAPEASKRPALTEVVPMSSPSRRVIRGPGRSGEPVLRRRRGRLGAVLDDLLECLEEALRVARPDDVPAEDDAARAVADGRCRELERIDLAGQLLRAEGEDRDRGRADDLTEALARVE